MELEWTAPACGCIQVHTLSNSYSQGYFLYSSFKGTIASGERADGIVQYSGSGEQQTTLAILKYTAC